MNKNKIRRLKKQREAKKDRKLHDLRRLRLPDTFHGFDVLVTPVQFSTKTYNKGTLFERNTVCGFAMLAGVHANYMAVKLKLPRGRKTDKGWLITKTQRKQAIKLGAVPWGDEVHDPSTK